MVSSTQDFLLELFSEEIPARMQAAASAELVRRMSEGLKTAGIAHGAVMPFVTPRRIAVKIDRLPERQEDRIVEKKGPKVGAPQAAIDGFCRSSGVAFEALETREIKGEPFYFAVEKQTGRTTLEALPAIAESALNNFPWPKSMRWGNTAMTWVRPLRRIVCLLGESVVPVTFGHLTSDRITEGHRFLNPGEISLRAPDEYEAALEKAHVIARAETRRDRIAAETARLAAEHGGNVRADEKLLDEVTGLVEWPVVYAGEFEAEYLDLPPEVLVLEMRHHQKYFAVENEGKLLNRFLVVANLPASDGGKAIVHGNRRVLRARLDDGRFYWDQDRKRALQDWNAELGGMTFHARLGSMRGRAGRIEQLAEWVAARAGADVTATKRAASLAKADLVTGMVGEFPELQGVMGRYYAQAQGEDAVVADAIRDHYKPAGAEDAVPTEPVALAVALADKLDMLVGLFAAGEKPTGSKDPFALRRAALGIVRIIRENALRLSLHEAVTQAARSVPCELTAQSLDKLVSEVMDFFAERIKAILKAEGVRHDLVAAVLAYGEDDLVRLLARVATLQTFLEGDDGANLLTAYRRAANIVGKEEKAGGLDLSAPVDPARLVQDEERVLHAAFTEIDSPLGAAMESERYGEAMTLLSRLRSPLDTFFDTVTVNADDPSVRENRLRLLASLRARLDAIAAFAHIEG